MNGVDDAISSAGVLRDGQPQQHSEIGAGRERGEEKLKPQMEQDEVH